MPRRAQVVLVMSPRYANDVAMGVQATGMVPRVERLVDEAVARIRNDSVHVAVVDARGAFEQGLDLVRSLAPEIERRQGGLLVLLSRSNSGDTGQARADGATSVLVSPFNSDAFGNALRLTARNAEVPPAPPDAVSRNDLAVRDQLTGLATGDQFQQWLTAHERPELALSVITLGVGRIGAINAAYGRGVADEALRCAAMRLTGIASDGLATTGQHWLLARLAAAEFAIGVAGDTHSDSIDALSRQLVTGFSTPFIVGGRDIHLTTRIGMARLDGGPGSAEALIRQGSAALAAARAGEPGTINIFNADSGADALLRMADLVGDLHRAIENEDITLLFQPVLDFASGRIAAVEALVRWDHRVFGLLDAETLLETAAAAELAVRLGRHIRSRAMREVMGWPPALGGLRLALNVTAADLADPGFVEGLEEALAASTLPRERLTLEITEGALIDNIAGAALVLERLRQLGIHIVLDDFGTGFSSLAWLARLPIDGIKLDRSFTRAMGGTERERIVVETVVALARRLGLTVVAEGVEEPVQLGAAFAAGCHAVQGFEIAVPLSTDSLVEFCDSWVIIPGGRSD